MKKTDGVKDSRARLKIGAYRLIETEPQVVRKSQFRPDVVVYASNAGGNLVPRLVVEIRHASVVGRPIVLGREASQRPGQRFRPTTSTFVDSLSL